MGFRRHSSQVAFDRDARAIFSKTFKCSNYSDKSVQLGLYLNIEMDQLFQEKAAASRREPPVTVTETTATLEST